MAEIAGNHALIIEDEVMIALHLEHILTDLGFGSIDIADDVASAVACAQRHRPDMITADGRIRGGTGMQAVDQITSAMGAIPVIYVTGNPTLLADRADPVVSKPFSNEEVAAACERVYRFH